MLDLYDVSRCPRGPTCERCGRREDQGAILARGTVETVMGVFCATVCVRCSTERSEVAASLSPIAVAERVGRHCEHLGIDLDEMVAALD